MSSEVQTDVAVNSEVTVAFVSGVREPSFAQKMKPMTTLARFGMDSSTVGLR